MFSVKRPRSVCYYYQNHTSFSKCLLVPVFINLYSFKILIPTEFIWTSEPTIFVAKLAIFYQITIFLNYVIKYSYAKDGVLVLLLRIPMVLWLKFKTITDLFWLILTLTHLTTKTTTCRRINTFTPVIKPQALKRDSNL